MITAIPCRFFYSSCKRGPVRACSLSPSKFKIGVRNKFLTPVNSPLILIPITATIRTRQIFFVITILFFNIVSVHEKGGWERERNFRAGKSSVYSQSKNIVFLQKMWEKKLVKFLIGIWFIKR